MNLNYEYIATDRNYSMFEEDVEANREIFVEKIKNSKIAIIGAAGSIGSSLLKQLLRFHPKEVVLFDINENNLVEVVRDLRSSKDVSVPKLFSAIPIGIGSEEFLQYFRDNSKFDYVFNLCAMKHVRSEKDIYSVKRMIDTNILFVDSFLKNVGYNFKNFFSVSSDKAVEPANVMGASKLAMEQILLLRSEEQQFSTARFANVAFSDGSLPYSFLNRINKKQPIVAPSNIKRYFISHEEAGQLCLLSSFLGGNGDIFFPKLSEDLHEKTFQEIATKLLVALGYEPVLMSDEDEAKESVSTLIKAKKWPCVFKETDTTGEKPFEEFYKENDVVEWNQYKNVGVVKQSPVGDLAQRVHSFLELTDGLTNKKMTKEKYVHSLKELLPSFSHAELNKNLDQKM